MGGHFSKIHKTPTPALTPRPSTDKNGYLAKPSGKCCLKGTIHDGEPRGHWETIADVTTYISTPPKDKANGHVLLYFPDVWGMFPNGLLVMDAFADAGFLTLGLDYFRGDPVWKHRKNRHDTSNSDFDYEAWKRKHTTFADEAVPRWVKAVIERYQHSHSHNTTGKKTKFVCVGYCFGAPYVCNMLAGDGDSIVAGAFAHPAFLKESHFCNIQKPLFLSCAETDHTFDGPSRQRALQILQQENKTYHYQLFSGVEHGFALRGDPGDPYQRKAPCSRVQLSCKAAKGPQAWWTAILGETPGCPTEHQTSVIFTAGSSRYNETHAIERT
ncbi:Putative Dienelactone hydrolase [Aspergillus calidoustus]|uniref:Putative Dienelactone hydrolase n=1 Tax=Aspergillus calidoustus TaxID=454130 RepID=A0A0U5FYA5_ASPCI|nr:Putative Dienelactone hydrolase [Aspergillus calidoustus]